MVIITTKVKLITTAVVIITTTLGIDSHRGGNQFPPLAESQGTYAVGCCPVGCCPVGCCPASVQWRHQPIFIGVQWRIRVCVCVCVCVCVQGVRTPPLRIFDDSYYVTPCPKLRDLGASHARLCLYTVGQTTDVPPPPALETPASAPGVAVGTPGHPWLRHCVRPSNNFVSAQ